VKRVARWSRRGGNPFKWTTLALAVPLLAACDGPQSALSPAGPMARDVANVWWAMFGFSVVVLLVVSALWIYAMLRRPRTHTAEEAKRINRRWIIGGGLILPTVTIIALLAFGIPTGRGMLPLPVEGEQPLRIQVIGHQWWWEVRYPESGVVTANQFILPVDRPVDVEVTSADVIHSFWVPRLGGKLDMVPGRTNTLRVQAAQSGIFRGQCSEFCGSQHAHMILHVEALEADAFASWIETRRELQHQPPSGDAGRVFAERCGQCHRVTGVSEGNRAPDLSDLAARPTLGAGVIANDADGLRRWLSDHQSLKHGNAMPRHDDIPEETLGQLADWLETLAP
jgi:cytochrome c oxidase subunit 2